MGPETIGREAGGGMRPSPFKIGPLHNPAGVRLVQLSISFVQSPETGGRSGKEQVRAQHLRHSPPPSWWAGT
eukprot:4784346-Pyramimonas_sp.AAC.1